MSMQATVMKEMKNHLSGLIGGMELSTQEIDRWILLLTWAEEVNDAVEKARFYGFSFITCREDITEAIVCLQEMRLVKD